jgi:hypothetical protein
MITTYQRTNGTIFNVNLPERGKYHCDLLSGYTCMNREQCLGSYNHMCVLYALKNDMIKKYVLKNDIIKKVDIDKLKYDKCELLFPAIL